jgi:DNA-binding IclR family transcriptional regulator
MLLVSAPAPKWKFLTNHAQVLVCVAHDPSVRLREISERVEITERAAHRIVDELVSSGYIERERVGRRNRYTVQAGALLADRLGRLERVRDLQAILSDASERASAPSG